MKIDKYLCQTAPGGDDEEKKKKPCPPEPE